MPNTSTTIPLDELRTAAGGAVITPDEPEFEQARQVFYRNFDRRPAVIVRPESAASVARIVSFARESSTELAVRGGGHSLAGHGVSEGGIVLDLGALKAMEVDPHARTASAQTGLTAAEYTTTAGEYGLATGFGDTGVVGIGGLTLGGGVGFLSRRYGLTIDDLLGAEIVTADGEVLHVDDESHPDLFWAIRGGGGNFGVATKFTFRLHELPSIVGGMLILPASPQVIESFIAAADDAPDELSAIANIMVAPPVPFLPEEAHGKPIIMALVCYAGDADSGARAVAPFRALAKPVADLLRPMAYPEIYALGPSPPPPNHDAARSFFLEGVDATAAETIVEQVRASTAPMAVAQLRVLGGAVARVPAEATAYAHRDLRIMVAIGAVWDNEEDSSAHESWVDGFARALERDKPGVYVNFVGDEGEARVREAYPGETWDRLAKIKTEYDPTNLFRLNQNVDPHA